MFAVFHIKDEEEGALVRRDENYILYLVQSHCGNAFLLHGQGSWWVLMGRMDNPGRNSDAE